MNDTPAARRLRRLRWALTATFAAATAASLLVLAVIAINIDGDSRRRELDGELRTRAEASARTAYFDQSRLHLEYLDEDELALSAEVLAVVRRGDLVYPESPTPELLPEAELRRVWRDVARQQSTVLVSAAGRDGVLRRWAASPIWDDDEVGATAMVGADPAPVAAARRRLVRALTLGCLALVALGAGVGYLLSGRAMRPALHSLDRQEQFLTEAAHELRTPLTTMRLVAESGTTDSDRAVPALHEVVAQVDGLSRLVSALLVRARLEAGTQVTQLVRLRLDQVVERTVEETAGTDRVRVSTEPCVVAADPELMSLAVRNLVENALRYGAGTGVTVECAGGTVTVTDGGPGIDQERLERVFDRGVGSGAGTGTGLAIVRWVADLHQGSVRLSRPPGGGLRAELTVPLSQA